MLVKHHTKVELTYQNTFAKIDGLKFVAPISLLNYLKVI